jgi:hypothetical protein
MEMNERNAHLLHQYDQAKRQERIAFSFVLRGHFCLSLSFFTSNP